MVAALCLLTELCFETEKVWIGVGVKFRVACAGQNLFAASILLHLEDMGTETRLDLALLFRYLFSPTTEQFRRGTGTTSRTRYVPRC